MAWDDDMPELVRNFLFDLDTTQAYTDEKLLRLLVAAAFNVCAELTFDQPFAADLANTNITPDPTAAPTVNTAFVNLTCLRAAAIVERGEASKAAKQGIYVRDGSSAIDLRGVSLGRIQLIGKGWNEVYERAKLAYQMDRNSVAGRMVAGPVAQYQDRANV